MKMNLLQVKKIIREELTKLIKVNKLNEARISGNQLMLSDLIYEVDPSDLINLKVYDKYNNEWVWIKSYEGGSKIWCGDDSDPNSEEGWSFNTKTLLVDLEDEETRDFLEDIGYL